MDLNRFEHVELLPSAKRYRTFLDDATQHFGWDIAAAIVTIFVEGSSDERSALEAKERKPPAPLEDHPLVKYYGLPVARLALTKAHREVEDSHRAAAWDAILNHVVPTRRGAVVRTMNEALDLWLAYRDGVAETCGLTRPSAPVDPALDPLAEVA
jgi:pyrroloquinoline-quinone synthase